jgi:transposase-like protein
MLRIGLPTLHAPSAPQPGWSHHTPRSTDHRRVGGTASIMPVTNAIERLHEEFKRRIKTQCLLPCAETAAMLFWALLASGQITMRRVDGWPTLERSPTDLDLAA